MEALWLRERERGAVDQRDSSPIADGADNSMVAGFYQSLESGKHSRPIFPGLD